MGSSGGYERVVTFEAGDTRWDDVEVASADIDENGGPIEVVDEQGTNVHYRAYLRDFSEDPDGWAELNPDGDGTLLDALGLTWADIVEVTLVATRTHNLPRMASRVMKSIRTPISKLSFLYSLKMVSGLNMRVV